MDKENTSPVSDRLPAAGEPQLGLKSPSLFGLGIVQFLTVLNDNTFRWLVVPVGYALLGPHHRQFVLALGLAAFVVPYILLVAPAGYLADRYTKQRVMAGTMLLQAAIVALGMVAILLSSATFLFIILALMGAQGALLAPAKAGSIPEIFRKELISAANGVLAMASVGSAVAGSLLGNTLFLMTKPAGKTHWWISGATVVGIALLGWAASLLVLKVREADPERAWPKHLFEQTWKDLRALRADTHVFATAVAKAYFWFLAALSQVNVYLMGSTVRGFTQRDLGYLLAVLAGGAATGAILAGVWSAKRVELGLTPIGAAGITFSATMMFIVTLHPGPHVLEWSLFYLFIMGMSSGIYDVPLSAYIQTNSPERTLGEILAASNFLNFAAMLISSILFWITTSLLRQSAGVVFLAAGLTTSLVFVATFYVLREDVVRAALRPWHWIRSRTTR